MTRTIVTGVLFFVLSSRLWGQDPYERYVRTSRDFTPVRQDPQMLRKAWPSFIYMPWTHQWHIGYSDYSAQWSRDHGYNGAFIDRDETGRKLQWIDRAGLPFYVDHVAGKGYLHLWDGNAVKPHLDALHGNGLRTKPLNAAFKEAVRELMRKHIDASKGSPNRAAYALDDEISWGHFVHPAMWRITDDGKAYAAWLREVYGDAAPVRNGWITYADIQPRLSRWKIADFDASPLMDQWTFNDAWWANALGDLVQYANSIDPDTPCGFVGGQNPSAFGGFDYARLMRKVQFIEAYNMGSSQAIIRSFNPQNAIPAVTTHFHRNVNDTVWQAWYYLAHGNRGFIGWVEDWFDADGAPREFHQKTGPQMKEVETISKKLDKPAWRHDGVAIYYSHPSIQLSWILDAQAHGRTWTNRNNDHRLGSSHLVRQAWENMLRDSFLQYSFINYVDVIQRGVPEEYKVVILPACLCLSDAEAKALRAFVERGGTLVADYLPGVWDQHGRGRKQGGALDDLFGVRHDPEMNARGVFGQDLWVETDQDKHYSYDSYDELLATPGIIMDASGFHRAVRKMETGVIRQAGRGKAILMNLSPQWYNAYRVRGMDDAAKRSAFIQPLGLTPAIKPRHVAPETFGMTITRWAAGGRTYVFVVMNPETSVSSEGGGNSVNLRPSEERIVLELPAAVKNARNERTGAELGDGDKFQFIWNTGQAVVLSYEQP